MVHIRNDTDRYWNLFHIGCKVIDGGAGCRTIETLAERTATIAAVPDSLQSPHCSRHCAFKLSGFMDHNHVDVLNFHGS